MGRQARSGGGSRPIAIGMVLFAGLMATLLRPEFAGAADAESGKLVFQKCAACHRLESGKHAIGPSLHGVLGRKAGTAEGFRRYSDTLRAAGFVWTRDRLDQWLAGPKKMLPGTRMPFAGLPKPEDRADVIEYLAEAGK